MSAPESEADYTVGLPRKRMGAGVAFFDAAGRMLLAEPAYKDYWEFLGGVVEADESPYEAAVREVKEEIGIDAVPGRLLVVDWVPPHENRTEGVMVVFDGGVLTVQQTSKIRLDPKELLSVTWSTPAVAQTRMSPLLARRANAVWRARAEGIVLYLENGYHIV